MRGILYTSYIQGPPGTNTGEIFFFFLSFFRDGMPSLSSSYNISGLVPVCWLLFQCFVLKPAKIPKS